MKDLCHQQGLILEVSRSQNVLYGEKEKLLLHQIVFSRKRNMLLTKFQDKKLVYVLSNYQTADIVEKEREGEKVKINIHQTREHESS